LPENYYYQKSLRRARGFYPGRRQYAFIGSPVAGLVGGQKMPQNIGFFHRLGYMSA